MRLVCVDLRYLRHNVIRKFWLDPNHTNAHIIQIIFKKITNWVICTIKLSFLPFNPQNSVRLSWTWTWQSREIKSLYGILIDYEGFLRKGSPWRFWGGQSLCRSLVGGELSLSGRRVLWKVPFTATEFDWKDCETDASNRWARFFISLALQNSVFENEEIRKFRQFCAMFKITFTWRLSASYHLITNNLAMWSMSLILWVTFSWGLQYLLINRDVFLSKTYLVITIS